VWVARLSKAWLGLEGRSPRAISESARARLGPHAGILQQYLFHCARCGLIET
jgi:3-methyladenine DNA glycosylase/8-oxoguanine DNA glycosylase